MGIILKSGQLVPVCAPPIDREALRERLARTMARLHTRSFLIDVWARAMDEDGQTCPWYPSWVEWAQAAKDGDWPDMSKAPWEK